MTREDVLAQVQVLSAATGRDAEDLLQCTIEELTLITTAYREAGSVKVLGDLDKLVLWLGFAASVAGPVATIAGAIVAVFGVAALV